MPINNMEKEELLKRDITISGMEIKTTQKGTVMTKLKDEKGLNYNIFHTKLDGDESKAYQTYKTLEGGGVGKEIEVIFKEKEFTNEHGTFTARNVAMINVK